MWALLQALAIGFVAAVLFVAVEKIEPNRPYAYLFMFLILAVGMLAIVESVALSPRIDTYPSNFYTVCAAPMRRSGEQILLPPPPSLALPANDAAADASKQLASRSNK